MVLEFVLVDTPFSGVFSFADGFVSLRFFAFRFDLVPSSPGFFHPVVSFLVDLEHPSPSSFIFHFPGRTEFGPLPLLPAISRFLSR